MLFILDSLSVFGVTVPVCLSSQLQAELQRLEDLKKKNIERVIRTIRSEIVKFWEKCYYSLEQRQAFTPYYSGMLRASFLMFFTTLDVLKLYNLQSL